MTKLENASDLNCLDGYFYQLKAGQSFQKSGGAQVTTAFTSSDKLKDFIDVKVKVVSTQLTQNGNFATNLQIYNCV
jgi:hypothetical protein